MLKLRVIGYWFLRNYCPTLTVTTKKKWFSCQEQARNIDVVFICLYYRTIRPDSVVRSIYKATGCSDNSNHHVIYLEHVVVRITITHPRRGDLSIYLTSPSGTRSQLLANRYSMTTQLCNPVSTQSLHWNCSIIKEQSSHYSRFCWKTQVLDYFFWERWGKWRTNKWTERWQSLSLSVEE